LIYPAHTRTFQVQVNILAGTQAASFKLGVVSGPDVASQFLDSTPMQVKPSAQDNFPMYSNAVSVHARETESSFINYPNPFAGGRQTTTVEYFLEQDAQVSLKIYSLTGVPVRVLVDEQQSSSQGTWRIPWDGRNGTGQIVLNGVYFAVLKVKPVNGGATRTLMLKIAMVK
jgi:hypothetical protein